MKLFGMTALAVSQAIGVAAQPNIGALAYAPSFEACPFNTTLVRLASKDPGPLAQPQNQTSTSSIPPLPTATTNDTIAAKPAAQNAATAPNGTDVVVQYLSAEEQAYITQRRNGVLPGAWVKYLASVNATGAQLPDYIAQVLSNSSLAPTLGIAQSGGGLRAALVGAGIMNALDGRNASSVAAGTGGLLQAASYISGLSGGAWLLTSLSISDYPPLHELVLGSPSATDFTGAGWLANYNIFQPTAPNDTVGLTQYIGGLLQELGGKRQAGYPVTFADVYSRALSRHFLPGTTPENLLLTNYTHGAGMTFSDITRVPGFMNYQQPFPIVVANTDSQNGNKSQIDSANDGVVPINNPIYEFTPYEFGSWDPTLGAFTPMKYLGTRNTTICTRRFDQASFVEAISSNLWEQLNTSSTALSTSLIGPVWNAFNATYYQPGFAQISAQVPNPFKGVGNGTFIDTKEDYLSLVDGGHTGENVPLQPLLVKARGVDTIFVIDVSADTAQNFAAGQSLIVSKNRTKNYFSSAYSLPEVPASTADFISGGLNTRPTFFGCNSTTPSTPLLIYVANGGPAFGKQAVTNDTSFDFNYPDDQIVSIFDQSFSFATAGMPVPAGNATAAVLQVDPQWPACLACAVADRARARAGIDRSGVCVACFERYCWS